MESQSDFLISSPEKIISKLSVLLKNKSLLTVRCSENNATFVTTLLEIDKHTKAFICDGSNEDLTEQILESRKIFFKTEHLGAAVTFDTTKFSKIKYQGNPAFSVPIPSAMRWLEQREYYRVRIPATNSCHCLIKLENGETISLKVYDISLRGFSLLNTSEDLSSLLNPGRKFDDASLIFDDKQSTTVSFEIRSSFVINPNNLNKADKLGCKLSQLTPAMENTIHSFMLLIEREILKKRTEKTAFF